MKRISCGIVIVNDTAELLLCHATGTYHWDIPKGGTDPGEAPLDTALRETREECGLVFAADDLLDLGGFAYRPGKSLHLFATRVERLDPGLCRCTSHYPDGWGRMRPEMDAFEWTHFARIPRRCARHMGELLSQRIALAELLQQLTQFPPSQPGFVSLDSTSGASTGASAVPT